MPLGGIIILKDLLIPTNIPQAPQLLHLLR